MDTAEISGGKSTRTAAPVHVAGLGGPLSGTRGVPLSVPLPFLLTGVGAAALFGLLLPWVGPFALIAPGFPHVLALVHVATLGWLTMTIMGATMQLSPVILVTPLHAARLVRWQYPVYLTGVLLLVSGFWWAQNALLIVGGSIVVLAVTHYVIIMSATLAHATTRPLTARYLMASLIYLCVVVSLGLTAALNFQFDFLGPNADHLLLAHITLGLVGWLTTTLIGVSYTLVRMFALAHEHDDRYGRAIFVLINAGVLLLAAGFAFSLGLVVALGAATLIVGAWLYGYDYLRMLRVRRRKLLDVTQRHSIAATAYLMLVIALGAVAALTGWHGEPVLVALVLLALVGWLGQSTIGYLYKIVPFLIWNTRFGPFVGQKKVPLMRDLLHERWSLASWWLINLGLPLAALSALLNIPLALSIAACALGGGLALAAANVAGAALRR